MRKSKSCHWKKVRNLKLPFVVSSSEHIRERFIPQARQPRYPPLVSVWRALFQHQTFANSWALDDENLHSEDTGVIHEVPIRWVGESFQRHVSRNSPFGFQRVKPCDSSFISQAKFRQFLISVQKVTISLLFGLLLQIFYLVQWSIYRRFDHTRRAWRPRGSPNQVEKDSSRTPPDIPRRDLLRFGSSLHWDRGSVSCRVKMLPDHRMCTKSLPLSIGHNYS